MSSSFRIVLMVAAGSAMVAASGVGVGAARDGAEARVSGRVEAEELFRAAASGDVAGIRGAVSRGAAVNAWAGEGGEWPLGTTPLMVAAFHGRVEAARELLRAGALAEARTQRGWTAAHFAVMGGDGEAGGVMEALRAARPGVELEVPAAGGLTPRDLAAEMGER